jgi:hypothetical protein
MERRERPGTIGKRRRTSDKNDYTKALQRIDNEMSDYYLLGLTLNYNPTYTIKRK